MDHEFTKKIQAWLDTEHEKRDYAQGALYLLQLSNNQIMYRNISLNPKAKAEFIEYNIRKYMKFRLADLTKAEVKEMQQKVEVIAKANALSAPEQVREKSDFRSGKRQDHDDLPAEIQSLYVENASLMHRMRELHLKLRTLTFENATCPDSERYPFLKELIDLDKKYRKNWQIYDSYKIGAEEAEQKLIEDERQAEKNIYRQINLVKGRYKKAPTEKLKEQLISLYRQLATPVPTLTEELMTMQII